MSIEKDLNSKIIKASASFPKKSYTNDELIETYAMDTTSLWIAERTGIKQRYFMRDEIEFFDVAEKAARNVLSDNVIDLLVVATSSNKYAFPGLSQIIHSRLLDTSLINENTRTLDINAACNGFMQALAIADSEIRLGNVKNAVVVGVDMMSGLLDMQDRTTAILFGDGGGAVALQAVNEKKNTIRLWKHITLSKDWDTLVGKSGNISMNGRSVFEKSVRTFKSLILDLLQKSNLTAEDIDYFILHQANRRIFQALSNETKIDITKIPFLAENFGNISAGTIPAVLGLMQMNLGFNFDQDKKILLAGFGAGFTASAAIIY